MLPKPRSYTTIGITQILLAAAFVIWLLFFPSTGDQFAWPVTPAFTAMFIGAGFIVRTFIGFFLWREKSWPMLRWQSAANFAFLVVIFLATYWHMDEMNWGSNIVVAHIWVLAYTIEPVLLFLIEPRRPEARAPLPEELQRGEISVGLKRLVTVGLIVSLTIGALAFINPKFLDSRWPWPLDPFNARVIAAFLALAAAWCAEVYFARHWGEVRRAVMGLTIYAVCNFVLWLFIFPNFDPTRENGLTFGVAFGIFSVLLIYYFWKHERMTT